MSTTLLLSALLLQPAAAVAREPAPGQVTIHRDDFGVPHIVATTVEDGFFGLGYAQAEDILELLLMLVVRGQGELARVQGAAQVASDIDHRRWQHVEAARQGFPRLSPEIQRAYTAFIAGVRAFMREHPAKVPAWAPALEPWHAMVLTRSVLWSGYQAGIGLADCRRGGVRLAADVAAPPDRRTALASNEWVLQPWRTADNATIVLSDPHGGVDGTLFYEYRMHAGAMQSSGYAFGPMLLLAHNRTLAWGETTGNPDVADCYELEVDPKNPRRYRYDGAWQTMITRRVTIAVKDSTPVTRTLEYTRHNGVLSPVVARRDGKAWVVSTTYMDTAAAPAFDEEVFRLNLARDVFEARDAMRTTGMYPQNWMFGDSAGNIWYLRAGRTPRRPDGYDWARPVPGNTSASAWLGRHSLEDLVQVLNPPHGYLQNNNIAPDMMVPDGPVSADRYPGYIFNDRPGRTNTRALRAIEALSKAYAFTIDDAIDLALDEKWYGVEGWQRLLGDALAARADEIRRRPAAFRQAAESILDFDGQARASSAAALRFLFWQEALGRTVPAALLPELDRALLAGEPPSPAVASALLVGLDSAQAALERLPGEETAVLGDVFRLGRSERTWPLGGPSILPANRPQCVTPIEWDRHCLVTLRAMTFGQPDSLGQRRPFLGSRALRLVSFTTPIRAFTLHLFGQSGDPASPHYDDQIPLASERRLKPEYFELDELARHVVSSRTVSTGASDER